MIPGGLANVTSRAHLSPGRIALSRLRKTLAPDAQPTNSGRATSQRGSTQRLQTEVCVPRLSRLRFMDVDRTRLPVHRRIRSRGVPNALAGARHRRHRATWRDGRRCAPASCWGAARSSRTLGCRESSTVGSTPSSCSTSPWPTSTTPSPTDAERRPQSTDCYTVHMTSAGHAPVPHRRRGTPPDAVLRAGVSARARPTRCAWSRTPRRRSCASSGRRWSVSSRGMLGRRLTEPIVFAPMSDLTTDSAARWHGALQILSNEVLSTSR